MFSKLRELFARVLSDVFTSQTGDYDPARLFGYGFVILAATEFLTAFGYVVWKTGTFDATNFTIGVAGISTSLAAVATGVAIKKGTEVPMPPQAPAQAADPLVRSTDLGGFNQGGKA